MTGTTLVLDYDGTLTDEDYLDQVALEFGEGVVSEVIAEELTGRATVNDVIRREYATVRAPLEEVVAWLLEHVRMRHGFPELVGLAERRGWRVVVLSSGFHEFIDPVLEREGLGHLEVRANRVEARADGWRVAFVDDDDCDACSVPCKRRRLLDVTGGATIVYVGDGHSDLCAAEASDLIFAVAGQRLQSHLAERGIDHVRFESLTTVVEHLERVEPGLSRAG